MGVFQVLAAADMAGGGYVSIWKIALALLILLIWSRMLAWASSDAVVAHLPRVPFNVGNLSGLIVAYALFFLLPNFWFGFPILVVAPAIEAAIYLSKRKRLVGLGDLRKQWDDYLAGKKGKKKEESGPGEVVIIFKGSPVQMPEGNAPDRPAYDATQLALTEPLKRGADQVDIDGRTPEGASIKYIVDGVAQAGRSLDQPTASGVISYVKGLAGMDVEERRKPQDGTLKVTVGGEKHEIKVKTAGNTAGEYMRMLIDVKKRHNYSLETLGFSEAQLQKIKQGIKSNNGVVLLSTPSGMGLTSLSYGVLRGHDAFLQHIQTIERAPEEDLEGITQNKLAANAPAAEESKSVDWVISQEPDAIFINKIESPQSALELIKYSKSGKRVYVALRASSTFEALNHWRKIVGDDGLAVESLAMVINGRVLRFLCNNCKVPYAPDPTTLRKLGMNPEKVTQLFQARTDSLRDPKGNPIPCNFCMDLRYKGRTGVFELMVVDDDIRQAVASGKAVEPVFRKQRSKFLQEEALALVEEGDTSVQEVKRVLRPDAAATAAEPEGTQPPTPPPSTPGVGARKPPRRPSPGTVGRT
jgi:general secretion pathway protein E